MTSSHIPAAFLFDMDGTLVDNMAYHTRAWAQVMREEFDIVIDPADWERRTAGKPTTVIMREEVDPGMSDARIEQINLRKEELYRRAFHPNLALTDGAEGFLRAARQAGFLLAVCTSANKENLDFVLDGARIRPLFDAVLCKDDFMRGKPDPEIFLNAARRLGVSPRRCMVFEDAPAGIEAARRAGMRVVAIATMLGEAELLALTPVAHAAPNFTTLNPQAIAQLLG